MPGLLLFSPICGTPAEATDVYLGNHCSINKGEIATFPLYFHAQVLVCLGTAVEARKSKYAQSDSSRSQAHFVISTRRAKQHSSPGGNLSTALAHRTNTFAIQRTSSSTNVSPRHSLWPLLKHKPLRLLSRNLCLPKRTAATRTATSCTRRPPHTATTRLPKRPPPAARETTDRHTHPKAISPPIAPRATDTTTITTFSQQRQLQLPLPAYCGGLSGHYPSSLPFSLARSSPRGRSSRKKLEVVAGAHPFARLPAYLMVEDSIPPTRIPVPSRRLFRLEQQIIPPSHGPTPRCLSVWDWRKQAQGIRCCPFRPSLTPHGGRSTDGVSDAGSWSVR